MVFSPQILLTKEINMTNTEEVMNEIMPLLMKWQSFQAEIEAEIRKFPSDLLSPDTEVSQFIIKNRIQVEYLQETIMNLLVQPIVYEKAVLALAEVKKLNDLYSQLLLKFKKSNKMTSH